MNITGQCICGAVNWKVDGNPVAQFYCHCESCRKANSSPVVEIALFTTDNISINGETSIFSVSKQPHSAVRHSCSVCGSRVLNIPGGKNSSHLRGIFPALCNSTGWFQPSLHLFYPERRIDIEDSLPKFIDVPKDFGGSGELA